MPLPNYSVMASSMDVNELDALLGGSSATNDSAHQRPSSPDLGPVSSLPTQDSTLSFARPVETRLDHVEADYHLDTEDKPSSSNLIAVGSILSKGVALSPDQAVLAHIDHVESNSHPKIQNNLAKASEISPPRQVERNEWFYITASMQASAGAAADAPAASTPEQDIPISNNNNDDDDDYDIVSSRCSSGSNDPYIGTNVAGSKIEEAPVVDGWLRQRANYASTLMGYCASGTKAIICRPFVARPTVESDDNMNEEDGEGNDSPAAKVERKWYWGLWRSNERAHELDARKKSKEMYGNDDDWSIARE